MASCGRLIRDEDKKWIYGFTKLLGTCFAFITKCWSALCGLQEAGYRQIQMKCDSKTPIYCLYSKTKN